MSAPFSMKQLLNKTLSVFKNSIFPDRCISCKELFTKTEIKKKDTDIYCITESLQEEDERTTFSTLMKPYLCNNCITKYTPVISPLCVSCGTMFKERVSEDHLCGDCIKKPSKLRVVRSAGIYDQSLLNIIRAYKFGRKIQIASPLGILLFDLYKKTYWDNKTKSWDSNYPDLILPVPLHKKRFRDRKFNQAWLFIKDWKNHEVVTNILLRQKPTKPQTGLDKKNRKKNIKGAFCINNPKKIKGKKILLVDDVYTTGATASECAKVLLKNGSKHVDVLIIARTQAV